MVSSTTCGKKRPKAKLWHRGLSRRCDLRGSGQWAQMGAAFPLFQHFRRQPLHSDQPNGGPFIYGKDPDFDYAPEIWTSMSSLSAALPLLPSNFWPNTPIPKVRPQIRPALLRRRGIRHGCFLLKRKNSTTGWRCLRCICKRIGLGPHSFYIEVSDGGRPYPVPW